MCMEFMLDMLLAMNEASRDLNAKNEERVVHANLVFIKTEGYSITR